MTLTLRPEGKAGTIRVKKGQVVDQEEDKKMCEDSKVKLSISYLNK